MRVHASAVAASKTEVIAKIEKQLQGAQLHLNEIPAREEGDKRPYKGPEGICDNPHAAWMKEQVAKQLETLPEVKDHVYRVLVNYDDGAGTPAREYANAAVSCDIIKPQ